MDLAISYEPEVLLARDQGLPVKAVAAVVPTPLTSLIWLEGSGIGKVKDLRGKTVATAGIPYQEAYLEHDPRALRPEPRTTSTSSTSSRGSCRRSSPGAPTRCSAASSTSRAWI